MRSAFVVAAILSCSGAHAASLTARQVVERIQQHVGVPWRGQTVDTFKAGDPDKPVKGIAVTMMATYDVLERAAAAGNNFIITHEPTFYGHYDQTSELAKENDAVLARKQKFIADHGLVIWRFHDHWHARRPDGILTGVAQALGWERYLVPNSGHLFVIPQTTVRQLAAYLERRLNAHTLRVTGDPAMKVTKIALNPGAPGFARERHALQRPDVEVLITGEDREWELVEYAADAAAQGRQKALILLGHIPSEQAGMQYCATWLKSFVTEVPVNFVPTAEPFWRP